MNRLYTAGLDAFYGLVRNACDRLARDERVVISFPYRIGRTLFESIIRNRTLGFSPFDIKGEE